MAAVNGKAIVLDGQVGPEVSIGGKRYLYFGGTDYLNMAGRPEVSRGAVEAIRQYGVSPSAARTSSGTMQIHLDLERAAARFAGTEAAVIYSSGYLGMAVLLSGLLEDGDTLLVQRGAHSSIMEAVRAWSPSFLDFDLDNLDTLAARLDSIPGDSRVIVAGEGVSPLFGRVFPLPGVLELLAGRDYLVLLDDAHGFGVLGGSGGGTASHHGVKSDKVITCATLSKAFGSFGGVVPCTAAAAEKIQGRSMVYQCSTPQPAPVCGAAIAAFTVVEANPGIFAQLAENNRLLRKTLSGLGLDVADSPAPIVPLTDCGTVSPAELSAGLMEAGILAPFTSYPGSPSDGMVRIVVTAGHTAEQIKHLGAEMGKLL